MHNILAFLLAFLFSTHLLSQDLSYGLVAYYSFCDCTATDHSGNGLDGNLIGDPLCQEGIKGQGFRFNANPGVNGCGQRGGEYIQLPDLESVWDGGFSVCAWVQFENIANFERIIDFGNGNGDEAGLNIWFGREGNSDNLTFESWIDSDPVQNREEGRLVAQSAITNGRIEFYCATIDDRTMRIYVNGELVAQKEGNPIRNVKRTKNFIGRSNWCEADPDFKGFMDEVRIYNRPLSNEEIQLLYDSPSLVQGPDTSVCVDRPVQLSAQGGVRYEWTPATFLNAADVANPIATSDRDTIIDYQVEIFYPDNCSILDTISVQFDACLDCAGVPNGPARFDVCGECLQPDDPLFDQTCTDCAGVAGGNSVIDSCGVCIEMDSPDFNQSCADCAGVPNGNSVLDDCEVCNLPGSMAYNASCTDCNGVLKGTAELDNCGECLQTSDPNFNQSCLKDYQVFVPSAFSPNNDGINDELTVFGDATFVEKILYFKVVDRWGNKVFEVQDKSLADPSTFWNGQFRGTQANQGMYLYQLSIAYRNGTTKNYSGTVMLIF